MASPKTETTSPIENVVMLIFAKPMASSTDSLLAPRQVWPHRRLLHRSLQIIHALGCGERPRAARTISLRVEPLGARHGRRECCLRALLGPFHRVRRGLAIELRGHR